MKGRVDQLLKISRDKNSAFRRRFVGRVLPAITLSKGECIGTSIALTDNYINAKIPGNSLPANRLINIRIEDVRPDSTLARDNPHK